MPVLWPGVAHPNSWELQHTPELEGDFKIRPRSFQERPCNSSCFANLRTRTIVIIIIAIIIIIVIIIVIVIIIITTIIIIDKSL